MLSILIELQRLKNLDRTGWSLRGLPPRTESVASHSFGVAVAAMLLADQLTARGVEIDTERTLRLALLHDWSEARIGDMPRTASQYFGPEARKQAELAAFGDIVKGIGRGAAIYHELHEDYELRSSLEARLVKAADVIDLLVQVLALERAGAKGLDEFWEVARQPDFQLEGAANEIVAEIFRELLTARAQVSARCE
jgi:putative hydrolase of HD superfamily